MLRKDAYIPPCELRVATILAQIELRSNKKMSIKWFGIALIDGNNKEVLHMVIKGFSSAIEQ
jgi:hypothetical protein